ncbi:hypothetical protein OFC13_30900, partial [Escherichia coli]|nr:hypothetical protein [Escherichia coli]
IINKNELELLGADPRAAFALDANEGYAFGGGFAEDAIGPSSSRGTHGYLPTLPDYRASFIAAGVGIGRKGKIGEIR